MATETKQDVQDQSYHAMEEELTRARLEIAKLQRELDISRTNQDASGNKKHSDEFWARIWTLLNDRANDIIKDLINSGELSVHDERPDGMRLLALAARKGNAEVAQLAINLGADIEHLDSYGRTALQWSVRNAYFNCEQVITFAKMGAIVGQNVKKKANLLNEERGILENVIKHLTKYDIGNEFGNKIINIMRDIIEAKEIFSPDLLNLAWYFDVIVPNKVPSQSSLYKSIRRSCKNVINNTDADVRDWWWLKNYMLPSTVWLKQGDISININIDDETDETDETDEKDINNYTEIRTNGLYNELLDIVRKQEEIDLLKLEAVMAPDNDELVRLSKWGEEYKEKYDLRQDKIPNGIKANYTKEQLSRKAMPSPSFDLHGHYNYNEYLSRLIMSANMIDEDFQKDLEHLLGKEKGVKIEHDLLNSIYYKHGPVKTMQRSLAKAQTDYFNEEYPTSASIIDLNRCKIVVESVEKLFNILALVSDNIKYGKAGCIVDIVRVKNGFKNYVSNGACYADIKFNVIIKPTGAKESLIGEIQFLLADMNEFKVGAHRLYTISRSKELFDIIWKTLPLLTNDKTRTMLAGQNNDVSQLLNLMVVNNKKMEDILFVAHSNETILNTICCKGLYKSFEFIQKKADKKLFMNRILMPHQYNESCVEITIWANQIKILKRLFQQNPELMTQTVKNGGNITQIFRWVYWLVTKPGNSLFTEPDIKMLNYVLDLLKLNDKQWVQLLKHRAPRPKDGDFANEVSHVKYHVAQLFVLAVKTQKTQVILKLLQKRMSNKVFINGLFVNNLYNLNAIEQAVKDSKLVTIKYLFDQKDVINKINNSLILLYRLLYIAYNSANDETFDYLMKFFKISDDILFKFVIMNTQNTKEKSKYLSNEYDEYYSCSNLLIEAVFSQKIQRVKQLIELIIKKDGKNLLKYIQRKGRNNNACLDVCISNENVDLAKMILNYIKDKKSKLNLIKSCEKNENATKIIQQLKSLC